MSTKLTEKFNWVDRDYVTAPQGRHTESFRDCWWLTNSQGQVCLYRHFKNDPLAAQCNPDRRIAEMILKREDTPGAVDMVQIPLAFVDVNPNHF